MLFAPPARADRYEFLTSSETIDVMAAEYRRVHPSPDPRSWVIHRIGALDVFDGAALYDRARLARLYRGRTPRVARGPIIENGSVTRVVLLLSPYPEPNLERLNPGTLIMVVSP